MPLNSRSSDQQNLLPPEEVESFAGQNKELSEQLVALKEKAREVFNVEHASFEDMSPTEVRRLLEEHSPDVLQILQSRYASLKEDDRERFIYLSVFACHPATFSASMCEKVWGTTTQSAEATLHALAEALLITREKDKERYSISSLHALFGQSLFDEE